MQNEQPMCYITYAVPAHLVPQLTLQEAAVPVNVQPCTAEETPQEIYPPGFMPDWFLRGSFPEDDFAE